MFSKAFSEIAIDCLLPSCLLSKQSNQKLLWSDESSWTSSQLPSDGNSITIDKNSWLIIDRPIPQLKYLIINGNLSIIDSSIDINLSADYIQVNGFLEIIHANQNSNRTFTTIELTHSTHSNFPSRTIDIYGHFEASGQSLVNSYYQLHQTSNINETSVLLNLGDDDKNWRVGDEIVFSPTAYYTHEGEFWHSGHEFLNLSTPVETRTITAIYKNGDNHKSFLMSFARRLSLKSIATRFC